MTNAYLGYEINSSDANRAAIDLDKMTASANRAEASQKRLTGTTSASTGATKQATTASRQLEATVDAVAVANGRAATASHATTAALHAQAAASRIAMGRMQQMSFQMNDIATMLLMGASPFQIMATQGGQLVQIYQGQGGVNTALRDVGRMLAGVVRYGGPAIAAIGAVAAAVAGMRHEINRTSDVTVSFGDTALATWQVVRDGIYGLIQPAVSAMTSWFATAYDTIATHTLVVGNAIINSIRASVEGVRVAVSSIPDIFSAVFNRAAVVVATAMDDIIFNIGQGINQMVEGINSALGTSMPTISTRGATVALTKFSNERGAAARASENAVSAAQEGLQGRVAGIMGSNPLGGFFDNVSGRAVENALNRAAETAEEAGGRAAGAGAKAAKEWDKFKGSATKAGEAMQRDFSNAFSSIVRGADSARDAVGKMLDSIADRMLTGAGNSLFSGLFGGLFPTPALASGGGGQVMGLGGLAASVMHNGGIVGHSAPMRRVPMSAFATAERYHNGGVAGFKANEVPAILERGERIIPKDDAGGGSGGQPHIADVRVYVDDNGNWQAKVEQISASTTQAGLKGYDRNFEARMKRAQDRPRRRG